MSQVTKRALEQSLKNLLLKKPLTKITINDIAEDCGINRMTFYYHFKDIYDLVEWSCLEDAKRALDEKKTYETWQQGFLQIFEAVQDNKPFICLPLRPRRTGGKIPAAAGRPAFTGCDQRRGR